LMVLVSELVAPNFTVLLTLVRASADTVTVTTVPLPSWMEPA